MLAEQAWEPEFCPQHSCKKLDVVGCVSLTLVLRRQRQAGPGGLLASISIIFRSTLPTQFSQLKLPVFEDLSVLGMCGRIFQCGRCLNVESNCPYCHASVRTTLGS